ncbi:MAG: hypothetical protein GF311_08980 [Candidatus Lokiarchaeota archaeon]|nr:hypothetical protein [Candidatus Lokiarchaeota archaeon]
MPSDEELTLAVFILRAFGKGLGKANAKKIESYLRTHFGRYEISPKIFKVCQDLAKEDLLNETKVTGSDGKPDYLYNITVAGYSTIEALERDVLERKKRRLS